MKKAIFLDRDGVINPLVYNLNTQEYESPHYPEEFSVYPQVADSLTKLQEKQYKLFLVSNQPSYAKGKTSLENIRRIHELFDIFLQQNEIFFSSYYYCYHHPESIILEYREVCDCRKPKTKFLKEAQKYFDIDLTSSWFIGDQDTDIECGQQEGLKTILIENMHSIKKRGYSFPDKKVKNLSEAVNYILSDPIERWR